MKKTLEQIETSILVVLVARPPALAGRDGAEMLGTEALPS